MGHGWKGVSKGSSRIQQSRSKGYVAPIHPIHLFAQLNSLSSHDSTRSHLLHGVTKRARKPEAIGLCICDRQQHKAACADLTAAGFLGIS